MRISFSNGTTFNVLWASNNARWFIYGKQDGGIIVADEKYDRKDEPIKLPNGTIEYDNFRRVPEFVTRAVKRFL